MVTYSLSFACRFLLEQPNGSLASVHPRLEPLMSEHRIFKQGVWGGAWADDRSKTTPKRHILFSNDIRLLREFVLAGASLSKEELNRMCGEPLTKKSKKADGSTAWTGDKKRLSASQWGPKFGVASTLPYTTCQWTLVVNESMMPHALPWANSGRAYHPNFGGHLAQLKLQMNKGDWEVGW